MLLKFNLTYIILLLINNSKDGLQTYQGTGGNATYGTFFRGWGLGRPLGGAVRLLSGGGGASWSVMYLQIPPYSTGS
jgi:hypothetical protein